MYIVKFKKLFYTGYAWTYKKHEARVYFNSEEASKLAIKLNAKLRHRL